MNCKICGSETEKRFSAEILNKYVVSYHCCSNCGFMQTEEPYWLNEAYSAAISVSDTGVMRRNIYYSNLATVILRLNFCVTSRFLDFGGGYGIFSRLMRDNGFDFYWFDKYADNLVSRGFEGPINGDRYDALTSFENFEHFCDPMKEIDLMLDLTDFVLFSTELLPEKIPAPNEWWYYCLEHGQHISFFSTRTLDYITKKKKVYFTSNGRNIHVLSKKPFKKDVFFLAKIISRIGIVRLFAHESKTVSDMHKMIEVLKVRS